MIKFTLFSLGLVLLVATSAIPADKVVVVPLGKTIHATGSAVAEDVLEGKTFSNKDDVSLPGTMINNGAITFNPGTSDQNIQEGYHNGSGTVKGDANIAPENIKSGVSIFGVNGTSIEASGTVIPEQVLSGKTFSNASGANTGTMVNVGKQYIYPYTFNQTITQGYHDGTGLVAGDTNLVTGNIRSGAIIFGVTGDPNIVDTASGDAIADEIISGKKAWVDGNELNGTMVDNGAIIITPSTTAQVIPQGYHNGSGVVQANPDYTGKNIQTGQNFCTYYDGANWQLDNDCTNPSRPPNQDGEVKSGVGWPNPRFTDNNDGTITDNLTGLIWLKNGIYGGVNITWVDAMNLANSLSDGLGGLTDGSIAGDWRLPTVRELQSLITYRNLVIGYFILVPDTTGTGLYSNGDPFVNLYRYNYWTSSSRFYTDAWTVRMESGGVYSTSKGSTTGMGMLPVK